jgi:hypothetical protein
MGRNRRHWTGSLRRLIVLACLGLVTAGALRILDAPLDVRAGSGAGSFTDTTVADFSGGTTGPDTYIADEGDGEVILMPAMGEEFSGASLPPGWSTAAWNNGGGVTVANGTLTADGARASTDATFGNGHSLDFVATFGAETFQHVGFSDNFASAWAIFSTYNTTNQLFARTNNGSGSSVDSPIPGSLIGSSHRYRIDWGPSTVTFFVDGTLVATHDVTFGTAMRAIASDFSTGTPDLSVDWCHLSPYPAQGAFLSRIFDAGEAVNWGPVSWHDQLPPATTITLSVRTGATPTPDQSWTAFTPVASSGDSMGGSSRYVQYRADLGTSDANQTPVLQDVRIDFIRPGPPQTVPDSTLAASLLGAGAGSAGLVLLGRSRPSRLRRA